MIGVFWTTFWPFHCHKNCKQTNIARHKVVVGAGLWHRFWAVFPVSWTGKLVAISTATHNPKHKNIARHKVVVGAGLWHRFDRFSTFSSGFLWFWGQKWSKPWFWGQKMKKTTFWPKLPEVFAILSGDFILENRFFAFSQGGTQGFWKKGHFWSIFHFFSGVFDHFWSILAQTEGLRV